LAGEIPRAKGQLDIPALLAARLGQLFYRGIFLNFTLSGVGHRAKVYTTNERLPYDRWFSPQCALGEQAKPNPHDQSARVEQSRG